MLKLFYTLTDHNDSRFREHHVSHQYHNDQRKLVHQRVTVNKADRNIVELTIATTSRI
jgi:hypothetical protein